MSEEIDLKYEAYTSIGDMSPEDFQRLIDGRPLPLSSETVRRGREWERRKKGVRRHIPEKAGRMISFHDQGSDNISPFFRAYQTTYPLPGEFGKPTTVDNGDGTYSHTFDVQDPVPVVTAPEGDISRVMKDLLNEIPPVYPRNVEYGVRHYGAKPMDQPTVKTIARDVLEIGKTVFRIARAWVQGKP